MFSDKSVLNWTNPALKCHKLDKSKPKMTDFALNRCTEKKALAFLLVCRQSVRMETNTTSEGIIVISLNHDGSAESYERELVGDVALADRIRAEREEFWAAFEAREHARKALREEVRKGCGVSGMFRRAFGLLVEGVK